MKEKLKELWPRLKVILQGEFPRGEKLGGHTEKIIQVKPKPTWNEWCEEFNVASKVNPNKEVYYEI